MNVFKCTHTTWLLTWFTVFNGKVTEDAAFDFFGKSVFLTVL